MKLLSFVADGSERVGLLSGAGVIDLTARLGLSQLPEAFARKSEIEALDLSQADFNADAITYLPAVTKPERIFCIGLNYRSHLLETGREAGPEPMIFTRFASSQAAHGQPLIRPKVSDHFDFEGELALIIGRDCRHVPQEKAWDVIGGYACYNDGSIRDWQKHTSQFIPGKNFPQTGGFGPWVVTPDEIEDITKASLVTRLNGEEMQRAVISDLVFDIPRLIAYCSTFSPLSAGDVIVTGTTGGVGAARKPPVWMKPGDTVEVEITGVGTLVNTIADE
ncbi:MAG: fumarylacetoacetate hydrolase family protein [Devosia sp.]|nr:fumarylacetoacetate hydrolase family protein [Devosia sp.]